MLQRIVDFFASLGDGLTPISSIPTGPLPEAHAVAQLLKSSGAGISLGLRETHGSFCEQSFSKRGSLRIGYQIGIETQQCERNPVAGAGDVEQLSNQWDCLIGIAEMRVDLSERKQVAGPFVCVAL